MPLVITALTLMIIINGFFTFYIIRRLFNENDEMRKMLFYGADRFREAERDKEIADSPKPIIAPQKSSPLPRLPKEPFSKPTGNEDEEE